MIAKMMLRSSTKEVAEIHARTPPRQPVNRRFPQDFILPHLEIFTREDSATLASAASTSFVVLRSGDI